jgi:Holliday junction resolvase RusA-like endonuclease
MDLDNFLKAPLDVFTKCHVYLDDSQIDCLIIRRGAVRPPGALEVTIEEL